MEGPYRPERQDASTSARIAVVCDGFLTYGGSERVVEAILRIHPHADLFALVDFLPPHARGWLNGRQVRTSFLQHVPFARRHLRKLVALWPLAIEQFDFEGYDLVISVQFAVAHGVLTKPYQPHVAYISSPMRYAWDLQDDHLRQDGLAFGMLGFTTRRMLHKLRMWDTLAGQRPDAIAANSRFVAERVRKYYSRKGVVIYPPVFIDRFTYSTEPRDFYLSLGRLVPHKRVDLIVEAFTRMTDLPLVVAGSGPMLKALRKRATANITFVDEVSMPEADRLMGKARAYLHAAVEDFGITPVEAQATGTPVIALGQGGLRETIVGAPATEPTGLFFDRQTPEAIVDAVRRFEACRGSYSGEACARNAERFSERRFASEFRKLVREATGLS
ncbi:glycosyltransferase [Sphingomonas bacterium]|uniref:glycosyltransferase n=1 Tax=Sphingomonas bacterium TaxID=1895847 RepID=UPI0015754055|nr:glycosyltransferase [Sphingomonas bacterium]